MQNNWKSNYLRYKSFFLNILNVYYAKPNIKVYLELALSLIAVLIFSLFAIKPTVLTIIELNKEIKGKEEIIAKLDLKLANLQTANDILETEASRILLIDQAIPDLASPEETIVEMQNLAEKNSLQITNLSMSDIVILGDEKKSRGKNEESIQFPQKTGELPFNITLTGNYANFKTFIFDLENLNRPTLVDVLSINSVILDEQKNLTLNISGRMAFYKVDKTKDEK